MNNYICKQYEFTTNVNEGEISYRVSEPEANRQYEIVFRLPNFERLSELLELRTPFDLIEEFGINWIETMINLAKAQGRLTVDESHSRRQEQDWNIWLYDNSEEEESHYFMTVNYRDVNSYFPVAYYDFLGVQNIVQISGVKVDERGNLKS
jgi:hypothetical protein